MSDEKPKSAYDELMENAKHIGRFDAIAGHKFVKLATPEPPKPKQDAPEKPVEVSFSDAQKIIRGESQQ